MGAVLASECPPWTAGRSLSSAGTPTASKTRCRLAGRSDLPLQSCAGRGATSGPSRHQHLHRCLCGRLQVAPWSPATFVRPWSVELGRRAFAVLHERAFLPEETQIHLGIVTLSPPCDGTLPPRRGAWPSPAAAPAPAPAVFRTRPFHARQPLLLVPRPPVPSFPLPLNHSGLFTMIPFSLHYGHIGRGSEFRIRAAAVSGVRACPPAQRVLCTPQEPALSPHALVPGLCATVTQPAACVQMGGLTASSISRLQILDYLPKTF